MRNQSKVLLLVMLVLAFEITLGSTPLPAANSVRIDCPVIKPTVVVGDSVAIPVRITNDVDLGGFSLGFHYNSSTVQITSISMAGSILAAGPLQKKFVPASGLVLIGWVDFSGSTPVTPQTDGLVFTMYMRILPGAAYQCVDIDSAFVPPAGAFIFSPVIGNKIEPGYSDCGTGDVIIGGSQCPSSNTAPVVSDIPNQTVAEHGTFATITLDNYVTDAESPASAMVWGATSASPNGFSVVIAPSTRVATISYSAGEFSGSAVFTFTATDPGGLTGSDTARFTVTPVNDPPHVSGIPDQSLAYGADFATINLDSYVTDPDNTPAELVWTYAGNVALTVAISPAHVATITKPSPSWSGTEHIIFTATDPGALASSDTAAFTIASAVPVMKIDPDTLTFSAYAGGANPAGKGTVITNAGNGTLTWNAAEATAWFSLSSASGTAPSGFTVNVDITGLAPGAYTGNVTVTSPEANNSPQLLTVNLTVLNPVDILLTPDSLRFTAHENGQNPPGQEVVITNAIPSGMQFNWGAIETSPWLSMSATTGTSPSTVTFNVDITGLGMGTYTTQVIIEQTATAKSLGVTFDMDTINVRLIVDQATGVDDNQGSLPTSFSLNQNYPNPFNPETVIEYNLATPSHVTLTVYNVLGQKVVDIVNGFESAGRKQAVWSGKDESGRDVQSGVYFYRLTTDNFSMTRKMMLMK